MCSYSDLLLLRILYDVFLRHCFGISHRFLHVSIPQVYWNKWIHLCDHGPWYVHYRLCHKIDKSLYRSHFSTTCISERLRHPVQKRQLWRQTRFSFGTCSLNGFLHNILYLINRNKFMLKVNIFFTLLVAYSRIRKHCHTYYQVIVGGLIGTSSAILIWTFLKGV